MPKGMGYDYEGMDKDGGKMSYPTKGDPAMRIPAMVAYNKGGPGKKTSVIQGSQYMYGMGYKEKVGTHGNARKGPTGY